MADILDDADKAAEMFHLEALTRKKPEGPGPVGHCLCCGEEFPSGSTLLFCDSDCREWWEKSEAARLSRCDGRIDVGD